MTKSSPVIQIIKIFFLILKEIYRSIFLNDQESKNFLTSLYLKQIYSTSKLPLVSIDSRMEETIILSSRHFFQSSLKPEDRLTLQSPNELMALIYLLKRTNPSTVFEFGLMRGGSLLHFFLNTDQNVTIHSLDINLKNLDKKIELIVTNNPRIFIHVNDSSFFSDVNLLGKVDFIFIDGGHDYEIVKNDTQLALSMLSPRGTIVWDDYSPHFPGVFNFLNELFTREKNLRHIKGTSMVYLSKVLD